MIFWGTGTPSMRARHTPPVTPVALLTTANVSRAEYSRLAAADLLHRLQGWAAIGAFLSPLEIDIAEEPVPLRWTNSTSSEPEGVFKDPVLLVELPAQV